LVRKRGTEDLSKKGLGKSGILSSKLLPLGLIILVLVVLFWVSFLFAGVDLDGNSNGAENVQLDYSLVQVLLSEGESASKELRVLNVGDDVESISVSSNLGDMLSISDYFFELSPGQTKVLTLEFSSNIDDVEYAPGVYSGYVLLGGADYSLELPIVLDIESEDVLFDSSMSFTNTEYEPGDSFNLPVRIYNLASEDPTNVLFEYTIKDLEGNLIYSGEESVLVDGQASLSNVIELSNYLNSGYYVLGVKVSYAGSVGVSSEVLEVLGDEEAGLRNYCGGSMIFCSLSIILLIGLLFFLGAFVFLFLRGLFKDQKVGKSIFRSSTSLYFLVGLIIVFILMLIMFVSELVSYLSIVSVLSAVPFFFYILLLVFVIVFLGFVLHKYLQSVRGDSDSPEMAWLKQGNEIKSPKGELGKIIVKIEAEKLKERLEELKAQRRLDKAEKLEKEKLERKIHREKELAEREKAKESKAKAEAIERNKKRLRKNLHFMVYAVPKYLARRKKANELRKIKSEAEAKKKQKAELKLKKELAKKSKLDQEKKEKREQLDQERKERESRREKREKLRLEKELAKKAQLAREKKARRDRIDREKKEREKRKERVLAEKKKAEERKERAIYVEKRNKRWKKNINSMFSIVPKYLAKKSKESKVRRTKLEAEAKKRKKAELILAKELEKKAQREQEKREIATRKEKREKLKLEKELAKRAKIEQEKKVRRDRIAREKKEREAKRVKILAEKRKAEERKERAISAERNNKRLKKNIDSIISIIPKYLAKKSKESKIRRAKLEAEAKQKKKARMILEKKLEKEVKLAKEKQERKAKQEQKKKEKALRKEKIDKLKFEKVLAKKAKLEKEKKVKNIFNVLPDYLAKKKKESLARRAENEAKAKKEKKLGLALQNKIEKEERLEGKKAAKEFRKEQALIEKKKVNELKKQAKLARKQKKTELALQKKLDRNKRLEQKKAAKKLRKEQALIERRKASELKKQAKLDKKLKLAVAKAEEKGQKQQETKIDKIEIENLNIIKEKIRNKLTKVEMLIAEGNYRPAMKAYREISPLYSELDSDSKREFVTRLGKSAYLLSQV
jgi:hypothetical protein